MIYNCKLSFLNLKTIFLKSYNNRIKEFFLVNLSLSKPGFLKVGQVAPLGAMTYTQGATSSKGVRGFPKGAIRS